MKFFIQLGFQHENEHSFYPHVHGPFTNVDLMNTYISKKWPNDKEAKFLVFDAVIAGVQASSNEKPENEKRAPDPTRWTKLDDKYVCKDCGSRIMAARVAHPIWDGPFPCSGSGEVETEEIGYCPNCEKKPNYHGAPIQR